MTVITRRKPVRCHVQISIMVLVSVFFLSTCGQLAEDLVNPQTQAQFIGETNIAVEGEFLAFFHRYGGTESLGQPLSAEIIVDGWRVQYFEKGRLEYHPENEPAYRITVGWLGEQLNRRRPPIPASSIPSGRETKRRYFPKTGHTLSGDFLTYFETHGGSVRFGHPINEPFLLDGRLTQDLQSARFYWAPELSPPVILEDTGSVHLQAIGFAEH